MRILHYSLGMPPYRTGGLTKYVVDLVNYQKQKGHEVSMLYPGKFSFYQKTTVKKDGDDSNMMLHKLINPLPVPLLGGVGKPALFYQQVKHNFKEFLINLKPDIVHVHTLMGLPKEFLEICKEMKIRTIYTTHDYYGLCPKVNLLNSNNEICFDYNDGNSCISCNEKSYSMTQIKVMQSDVYKSLKDNVLMKKVRRVVNQKFKRIYSSASNNQESILDTEVITEGSVVKSNQYANLRDYSISMLNLIDGIHYNSTVAELIYKQFVVSYGKVINITHSDIKDKRKLKTIPNRIRLTFLGPLDTYKGFFTLFNTLEKVKESGLTNWILNCYGGESPKLSYDSNYYRFHGKYSYEQMQSIFDETDLLIIPSIWKETFGFIGLEALSHGVPLMVTSNAGIKDLIEPNVTGIVYEDLLRDLQRLLKEPLFISEMNKNIVDRNFHYGLEKHAQEIEKFYTEIRNHKLVLI